MQAALSGGIRGAQPGGVTVGAGVGSQALTNPAQMSAKQLCNIILQSTFPYVEAIMGLLVIEGFQVRHIWQICSALIGWGGILQRIPCDPSGTDLVLTWSASSCFALLIVLCDFTYGIA